MHHNVKRLCFCIAMFHNFTKAFHELILGINQIQRRLKDVDCVIEVHDARVSFCTTISIRRHIYVSLSVSYVNDQRLYK